MIGHPIYPRHRDVDTKATKKKKKERIHLAMSGMAMNDARAAADAGGAEGEKGSRKRCAKGTHGSEGGTVPVPVSALPSASSLLHDCIGALEELVQEDALAVMGNENPRRTAAVMNCYKPTKSWLDKAEAKKSAEIRTSTCGDAGQG